MWVKFQKYSPKTYGYLRNNDTSPAFIPNSAFYKNELNGDDTEPIFITPVFWVGERFIFLIKNIHKLTAPINKQVSGFEGQKEDFVSMINSP